MFTPQQYREKATEYQKRASETNSVNEILEFRALERNYATMADNEEWLRSDEEWMRNNFDDTVKAPTGDGSEDISASEEEHILRCLGAAVMLQWNTIPTKLKRELFDNAGAMGELPRTKALRAKIARFLHQNKDGDH